MYENLTRNLDGSYTFLKNGYPYNCPNMGEWLEEYAAVHAYAMTHPDEVAIEPEPEPPTLEEAKAAKMEWNHAHADGLLAQAKAGYTLGEIESWDVQKRGAADILSGNTATEDAQDVTALYDRRIAVGGETMTIEQFCQRILANAAAYRAYSANVNGVMQGIDAIIRRCETVEQVQGVVWPENLG